MRGNAFVHLLAAVVLFLLSVSNVALPTSASEVKSTDRSVTGRPVGFARIVEDGVSEVSKTLESFDMWDITTFCTLPSGRSHFAKDFESQVQLRVEAETSQLIFEIDTLTSDTHWSALRTTGSHAKSSQRSWRWRDIRVTFEKAIQWSQAGPGGINDWFKAELSIVLQDPQLPSGEPIWKFYQVLNHWSIGVGAISGQTIYNPLIPLSGAVQEQGSPFRANITSFQSPNRDQTA